MKESPTLQEQASALNRCWQDIENLYEAYAKSVGLTYMSLLVLDTIAEAPEGCTQKQLAERMHMPKQSVNAIVKAFWEQGHVALHETPADRRNKLVTLTGQGKAYADEIIEPLWQAEQKAMGNVSPAMRVAILESMAQYEKELAALLGRK